MQLAFSWMGATICRGASQYKEQISSINGETGRWCLVFLFSVITRVKGHVHSRRGSNHGDRVRSGCIRRRTHATMFGL